MKTDKNIDKICSTYIVSDSDKMKIPKDALDRITKNQLAQNIANFIVENLDGLPIKYEIKHDYIINPSAEKHTIKMNLISDDELRRLKEIEYMYNDLRR